MPINTSINLHLPYVPDDTVAEKRESAPRLIEQILELKDVSFAHQKEMLSIGLWKWTEAVGVAPHPKYRIPLRSAGAINVAEPASVNHEHVWPRRWLIKQLLRNAPWSTESLRGFLERYAVACIVTVAEHAQLGATRAVGWRRYELAGIEVHDMLLGRPFLTSGVAAEGAEEPEGDEEPEEIVTESGESERTHRIGVGEAITARAGDRGGAFLELLSHFDDTSLVAVVGMRQGSDTEIGDYLRLHDARLEEPTPAVAYLHWSGKLSLRLALDDLPVDSRYDVEEQKHPAYDLRCYVHESADVPAAVELLSLALEKVREL